MVFHRFLFLGFPSLDLYLFHQFPVSRRQAVELQRRLQRQQFAAQLLKNWRQLTQAARRKREETLGNGAVSGMLGFEGFFI